MTAGLPELLRETRRRKGLTQAQVAEAIDCKQSAVSMFENGRRDALSREKLAALGKLLDVDVNRSAKDEPPVAGSVRFCPDIDCPSNIPFMVGSRVAVRPSMVPVDGDAPAYCRYCGEVLAAACPNAQCSAPPAPGAFCAVCGTAYVAPTPSHEPADTWVRARQDSLSKFIELTTAIERNQRIKGDHP